MLGPDLDWDLLASNPLLLLEVGGLVRNLLPSAGLEGMRSNKGEAVQKGMAVGGGLWGGEERGIKEAIQVALLGFGKWLDRDD